jgi:hypothetical protein
MQFMPGVVALVAASCMGGWVLHRLPPAPAAPQLALARTAPTSSVSPAPAAAAVPAPSQPVRVAANPYGELHSPYGSLYSPSPYGSLYDPGFASAKPSANGPSAQLQASLGEVQPSNASSIPLDNVPLPPKREVAMIDDAAPLPPPRPAEFASAGPAAPAVAAAPVDNRNFVEKLFGSIQPSAHPAAPTVAAAQPTPPAPPVAAAPPSPPAPAVAFATPAAEARPSGRAPFAPAFPTGRGFSFGTPSIDPVALGYDRYTAIYDISARAVYMPDGTKLEAHSGLGDRLDDARYVSERARGPTPPHAYDLTMREEIFHGVQALRLNPVGDGDLYGRAGLLAHPYMLGPNGDSNGCVSFKDYDAFLRAYQNGQVKRLVVVAKLD